MINNKTRFEWINKLDENELSRLLSKKELHFKPSEPLKNKVIYKIKNSRDTQEESKKKFPALKFAFAMSFVILVFTGLLFTYNFYSNKKPLNPNLNSCVVKYINGKSFILNETSGEKKVLVVGQKLDENSMIITEADANVELEINDNSVILIKEKSRLKTMKLFKDGGVKKTLLQLIAGAIFNDLQKLNEGSSFEVETKSVTVGVRGTKFEVTVSEENDVNIKTAEGTVYVKQNKTEDLIKSLALLNQKNSLLVSNILEGEKNINAGESLEVKYNDFIEANKKMNTDVLKIKNAAESNENYNAEEKILKHIREINDLILKIEKLNKEEENKLKENLNAISKIENERPKKKSKEKTEFSFSENFDSTPVGKIPNSWLTEHKNNSNIIIEVVDSKEIKPYSMPNSLKLFDNSNTNAAVIKKIIGPHKFGRIKFYYFPENKQNSLMNFLLKTEDEEIIMNIEFFNEGIEFRVGSKTINNLGAFKFNQWNEVIIYYELPEKAFNFECNQKKTGSIKLDKIYSASSIEFSGGKVNYGRGMPTENIKVYLDDIEFTSSNEKFNPKDKSAAMEKKKLVFPAFDVLNTANINADGPSGKDTYSIWEDIFGKNAVQTPDKSINKGEVVHTSAKHIIEESDKDVGNYFKFIIHRDQDIFDRDSTQRRGNINKTRVYSDQYSSKNAVVNKDEVLKYSWKLKLNSYSTITDTDTLLVEFKPIPNDKPNLTDGIIKIYAIKNNNKNVLQLCYYPATEKIVLAEIEVDKFKAKWIEFNLMINFTEKGFVFLTVNDLKKNSLLEYENKSIAMWKNGADIFCPIFGIYRRFNDVNSLKSAEDSVSFADISIQKIQLKNQAEKNTKKTASNKNAIVHPEKNFVLDINPIASISLKSSGQQNIDAYKNIYKIFGDSSINTPDNNFVDKKIKHISETNDSDAGNYFKFIVHRDQDKILTTNNQYINKTALNLKNPSGNKIVAGPNQAIRYSWKMRFKKEMTFSTMPTTFFMIEGYNKEIVTKGVGGGIKDSISAEETSAYSLFNLSGSKNNGSQRLQAIKQDGIKNSPVALAEVNLSSISGKWLAVEYTAKYNAEGYYKFSIKDLMGNEIMYCERNMTKMIYDTNFENYYPTWGIIRDVTNDLGKDEEEVDFADFMIEKVNIKLESK